MTALFMETIEVLYKRFSFQTLNTDLIFICACY